MICLVPVITVCRLCRVRSLRIHVAKVKVSSMVTCNSSRCTYLTDEHSLQAKMPGNHCRGEDSWQPT